MTTTSVTSGYQRAMDTEPQLAVWLEHHLDSPPQIKIQRGVRDDWEIWLRIDGGHAFADDAHDAASQLRDEIRALVNAAKRTHDVDDHEQTKWAPPKVIAHVDFSRMKPATAGANRGGLAPLAAYLGGRLNGQITRPGFHDLFRDEFGQNLDGRPEPPSPYYQLYWDGVCVHYVHSSLITDHGEDPPE
jgi:hypothetical protein